jgi:Cutinase
MTAVKWRFATLGVALAALLVSVLAATGSPAMAAPGSCANTGPVFFGLHGMNEGPPVTPKFPFSPEISGLDHEQNLISGAVLNDPVPYPTATESLNDLINLVSFVNQGEHNLQSYLAAWTRGCTTAQDKVALVGYSMGAWVINKWLKDHSSERSMIKAVVLYGDPCWIHGADRGLVRLLARSYGVGLGCSPPNNYPYPASIHTPPTVSYCLGGDPVCGGGFNSNPVTEVATASTCTPENLQCPHNWYRVGQPGEATLKLGAQVVVQHLVG